RSGTPGDPAPEMRNNYSDVVDAVRMMHCGVGTVWIDNKKYDEISMNCTESNLFNIFSFPLMSGSKTTVLEAPYTTVISQKTAKHLFGNENPLRKTITVQWSDDEDGKMDFEITGVM